MPELAFGERDGNYWVLFFLIMCEAGLAEHSKLPGCVARELQGYGVDLLLEIFTWHSSEY
jgi:hypothetical protein